MNFMEVSRVVKRTSDKTLVEILIKIQTWQRLAMKFLASYAVEQPENGKLRLIATSQKHKVYGNKSS